jgi:hypothetical protein
MKFKPWLLFLVVNIIAILFPVNYQLTISEKITHNVIPIAFAFIFNLLSGNGVMCWYIALLLIVNVVLSIFVRWRSKATGDGTRPS